MKSFKKQIKRVVVNEVYDLHGQIIPNNPKEFPNGRAFENALIQVKSSEYGKTLFVDGKDLGVIYDYQEIEQTDTHYFKVCNGWG